MHCKQCNRKFKETDEIVLSTINGEAYLHTDCHYDWLIRCDSHDYVTFDEMMGEVEKA